MALEQQSGGQRVLQCVAGVVLIAGSMTGCGPGRESQPAATAVSPALQPVQQSAQSEVTPEKIAGDIVGKVVRISDSTGGNPNEWTFEPSEFRRVAIIERKSAGDRETLVVFVTTQNNPQADEEQVRVSGKLQLTYERKNGQWVLAGIENLNFQYTIGVAT